MASKTVTCSGTSGSKYNLTLNYALNSQNIQANTSNITVYTTLRRNDGYAGSAYNSYTDQNTSKLTIAGTTRDSKNLAIDTRNGRTVSLSRWTGNVSHSGDGKLSISVGGSFTIGNAPKLTGGSVSATWQLPTIPRASSFSLSSTSVNAGGSFTITVHPSSSSFSHRATITLGSRSGTVSFAAGETSKSFAVPSEWMNVITASASKAATVSLQTLSGSSNVGAATAKSISITVPSSIVPSLSSITATRVDGSVPASWNTYVQGYSRVKLTLNGYSGTYGSAISGYSISGSGYSSSSSTYTTGALYSAGSYTFTGRVTDSRGRPSAARTVSISVVPYSPPYFAWNTSIYRCKANGTEDANGTYLAITPAYSYSSVNGKNSCSCSYVIRPLSGSASSKSGTCTNNTRTIVSNISDDVSWSVTLTLRDGITSSVYTQTIPTAAVLLDFHHNGKGLAVGKVAEKEGLDVAMEASFRDTLYFYKPNQQGSANEPIGYIYMDDDFNIMTNKQLFCNAGAHFSGNVDCSNVDCTNVNCFNVDCSGVDCSIVDCLYVYSDEVHTRNLQLRAPQYPSMDFYNTSWSSSKNVVGIYHNKDIDKDKNIENNTFVIYVTRDAPNSTIFLDANATLAHRYDIDSDRAKKRNITAYSDCAIDKVRALRFYQYTLLSGSASKQLENQPAAATATISEDPVSIGIMADEAPPEIVGQDQKSISLYPYICLLAKAMQEQQAEIDELRARLDALEKS